MSLRQSEQSDVPDFDLAFRGYDRQQVQECLADLITRLDEAQAGLDANTMLRRQLAEAQLEIDRLRTSTREHAQERQWGGRLSQVLALAEEQATALRAEAQRDAEAIRARAFADSLQARRDLEAALQARREREHRLDELLPTGARQDEKR